VDEWDKLAQEMSIHVPSISINGRLLPEGHYPYEQLQTIIEYQKKADSAGK
jgi:hypothetical protein